VSNVNLQAMPFVFRGCWSDIFCLTSFPVLHYHAARKGTFNKEFKLLMS